MMSSKRSRGCSEYMWTKQKITELIQLFESNSELWDVSNALYSNRTQKQSIQLKIAAELDVDVKDVAAKIHNLRCQYNSEMRKLKKKKSGSGTNEVYTPRWEYFSALNFLSNTNKQSDTTSNFEMNDDSSNSTMIPSFEIIDANENENENSDTNKGSSNATTGSYRKKKHIQPDSLQKETLLNNAMKIMSKPADSHQIFGDYIASEMRGMSEQKCKRLKVMIQKSLLKIEEEPDGISLPSTSTSASCIPSTSSTLIQHSKNLMNYDYNYDYDYNYNYEPKNFENL